MSQSSRLEIINRCSAAASGANMVDAMAVFAVLLLASMNASQRSTPIQEPGFTALRAMLGGFVVALGCDDIDLDVRIGRMQ